MTAVFWQMSNIFFSNGCVALLCPFLFIRFNILTTSLFFPVLEGVFGGNEESIVDVLSSHLDTFVLYLCNTPHQGIWCWGVVSKVAGSCWFVPPPHNRGVQQAGFYFQGCRRTRRVGKAKCPWKGEHAKI